MVKAKPENRKTKDSDLRYGIPVVLGRSARYPRKSSKNGCRRSSKITRRLTEKPLLHKSRRLEMYCFTYQQISIYFSRGKKGVAYELRIVLSYVGTEGLSDASGDFTFEELSDHGDC